MRLITSSNAALIVCTIVLIHIDLMCCKRINKELKRKIMRKSDCKEEKWCTQWGMIQNERLLKMYHFLSFFLFLIYTWNKCHSFPTFHLCLSASIPSRGAGLKRTSYKINMCRFSFDRSRTPATSSSLLVFEEIYLDRVSHATPA